MRYKLFVFFVIYSLVNLSFAYSEEGKSFTKQQYIFSLYSWENDVEEYRRFLDSGRPFINVVGWSNTGLFAYYRLTDDGSTPPSYILSIFNTIDDRIVENAYFQYYGDIMYHEYDNEYNRAEWLNLQKIRWNLLLEKYNIDGRIDDIINVTENNFLTFPVDGFECWFDYSAGYRNGDRYGGASINWELFIGNNQNRKLISSGLYEPQSNCAAKILGYYKSPFENRIAVFISYYSDGISTDWSPHLYGCNMDIGLRR